MRLVAQLVREEVFTFTPNDGSPEVRIRSGQLRGWLHENAMSKVIELTFPDDSLDTLTNRHGLELDRVRSITEQDAQDPVIVGLWHDGTHILIDGAHRRAYWSVRGVNKLKGWAVPEAVWRSFTFDANDPAIVNLYDNGGMLPQRRKK